MIEAADTSNHFSTICAVDSLSCELQSGALFALLGPNGAGKTTTLRMVLDILKPDTCRIKDLGKPLSQDRDRIGYFPEEVGLLKRGSTPDSPSAQIAGDPTCRVTRFAVAIPSLDDVVVTAVDGDPKRG